MKNNLKELRCLRCDGDLEAGFIAAGPNSKKAYPVFWIEDEPRLNRILGLGGLINISKRTRHGIDVFRCKDCGKLEQFAFDFYKQS